MSQWHMGAASLAAAFFLVGACQAVHEGIGDYAKDDSATETGDDSADAGDSADANGDAADDPDDGDDADTGNDDASTGDGGGEGSSDDSDSTDDGSTGGDSGDDSGSGDSGSDDTSDGGAETGSDDGSTGTGDGDGGSGDSVGDSGAGDSDTDDGNGDSDGDGDDDDGDDSDDGDDVCPALTHRCIDEPPGGWSGPIAFYQGGASVAAPACVGAFAETVFNTNAGLEADAGSCECACGDADAQCVPQQTNFRSMNTQCQTSSQIYSLTSLQCQSLGQTLPNQRWRTRGGSTRLDTGGSCPATVVGDIPAPTWSSKLKGCGGAELAVGCSSDDQVCAPLPELPFDARHCIYRAGEAQCPAGMYSERTLGFESFTDGRECGGSCECSAATGTCETTVHLFEGACDGTPDGVLRVPGECLTASGPGGQFTNARVVFTPKASCEASGTAAVQGTVATDGVVTVCCAP